MMLKASWHVLQAAVLADALQLHDWMDTREIEGSTIPKASAAIMVAAETSQVTPCPS